MTRLCGGGGGTVSTRGGGGALGAMMTVDLCADAVISAPPTASAAHVGMTRRAGFRRDIFKLPHGGNVRCGVLAAFRRSLAKRRESKWRAAITNETGVESHAIDDDWGARRKHTIYQRLVAQTRGGSPRIREGFSAQSIKFSSRYAPIRRKTPCLRPVITLCRFGNHRHKAMC